MARSVTEMSGLEGKHLDAASWRAALGGGLHPESQRWLIRHLSAGCSRCWRWLEHLAQAPLDREAAAEPDIVALALGRRPPADLLRPAHRWAVLDVRRGRLGFARLLLEEGRDLALRDPHRAEDRLGATRQLLAAAELGQIDPQRAHDLEALGWVYLADAQRVLGHHLEAEASFEAARRALAEGTGSSEVLASLDELRSQLLRVQGSISGALELLQQAEALLEKPGLEGRRAEVLGRRAALLLRFGDELGAIEATERALALLPVGQSPGLRLYLLHNGAATEARLGRIDAALAHLDEAEPLYEPYGHDFLRAQRFWVRGLVEMKARWFEAAEASLRTAVSRLLELGFGRSAVLALFDLARVYVAAGWEHRRLELEMLFDQLLERPAFRSLVLSHGRELMGLARRKGVAVPHLETLMQKVGCGGEPPVQ